MAEEVRNTHISLRTAVHEKIKESNSEIAERAAAILADDVVTKRVGLVTQAYTVIDEAEKELNKIRPDIVHYAPEGGLETKHFSKDQWEKKKKAEEKIAKLKKSLEMALNDPSKYGELASIITQK